MIRLTKDLVRMSPQWTTGEYQRLKRVLEEERDALNEFEKHERARREPQKTVLDGITSDLLEVGELLSILSGGPATLLEANRDKYRDFLVL
jgi:hypothetical protein